MRSMSKAQRCLMCADVMYEMTSFGEARDDQWPARRDDPRYGTVLICPHCDAEHLTVVDTTPGVPNVLRVRGLKPRE
jgi:hypothetical protein